MVDGPDDALDDVAVAAEAVGAEDGDRHDANAGIADAGDARAVVGLGSDDAGHRGAVAVRVGRARRSRRRSEVPATMWPSRSGCEASTPVSRTATTAEPAGVDGAVGLVPADLRQGPLVRIAGVVRGASTARLRSSSTERHGRIVAQGRDRRVGCVNRVDAKDGDRVGRRRAGRQRRRCLVARGGAGLEAHDVGARRRGGRAGLRGWLGSRLGRVRPMARPSAQSVGSADGFAASAPRVGSGVASGVGSALGSAEGVGDELGSALGSSARAAIGATRLATSRNTCRATSNRRSDGRADRGT